jgi:hypothetical protein
MGCIGFLIMRNIIVQRVPCAFLVCTGVLVGIYSKRIEVTYWDEVQVLLQEPQSQGKKRYRLNRRNRQALFFGETTFEHAEDLANLIRQQFQGHLNHRS